MQSRTRYQSVRRACGERPVVAERRSTTAIPEKPANATATSAIA